MKITIIGTGNMATGFATALAGTQHETTIVSRDPKKATELAAKMGKGIKGADLSQAAQQAEVIILAVPYTSVAEIVKATGDLSGKVLVDISNPITADYKDLTIGFTTSAAEETQKLAPQAKVVKGFNTVFASLLSPQARKGKTVQTFLAGDDAEAKKKVEELAKALGFEAVDAGGLSNSRFLEPLGEMNIHFGYFLGWGTSIAPAWNKWA